VDRFGRALPRPANRGPRDYALYKQIVPGASTDAGVKPRNAF
jgi:hypothetical protein